MDDIDFDELDRAVNSLISGTPRVLESESPIIDAAPPMATIEKVEEKIATPASDSSVVVGDKATVKSKKDEDVKKPNLVSVPYHHRERPLVTTPIAPPKPLPVTTFESLASKRSVGKFVDVVNGLGKNTKKIGNSIIESDDVPVPVNPVADKVESPKDAEPQMPVSVESSSDEIATKTPLTGLDKDIDEISNLINRALNPKNNQALKDEASLVKTTDNLGNSIVEIKSTKPVENSGELLSNQLPPELQNDLLAIESDDYEITPEPVANKRINIAPVSVNNYEDDDIKSMADNFAGQQVVDNKVPQSSIVQQPERGVIAIAPVSLEHPASELMHKVSQNNIPTYTSINQQYPEQLQSRNNDVVPIYDEDNYHDIDDLSTKKGPLVWFAWILSLVVIGAGVGMVAFFFVLPNLQ